MKINLSLQISQLADKGLSPQEIAGILEVEVEDVLMAIKRFNEGDGDVDDMLKIYRPRVLKKLIRICEDESIDNVSARVAAGRAILDYSKDIKGAEDELLRSKLDKMRERVNKALSKHKIIEINVESPNPRPELQLTEQTA